jgi:hypothetical protein
MNQKPKSVTDHGSLPEDHEAHFLRVVQTLQFHQHDLLGLLREKLTDPAPIRESAMGGLINEVGWTTVAFTFTDLLWLARTQNPRPGG